MERILSLIFAAALMADTVARANPPRANPIVVTPSGFEFEQLLVDQTAQPPGIVGELHIDMPPPIMCNGDALFHGTGNIVIRTGVYRVSSAELTVIANPGTPVPGSNKTFQRAQNPVCVGQQIFFLGEDENNLNGMQSVYVWIDGVITPIIEQGAVIGSITIRSFNQLTANEYGIGLLGKPRFSDFALMFMPHGEDPTIVADALTTVLPGQTEVANFYTWPGLWRSHLVFFAETRQSPGLYGWSPAEGISVIADTQTPAPVPSGVNFSGFFDTQLATLDDGLVFSASYGGSIGLFIWNGFEVRPLVLTGDVAEDGEILTTLRQPHGAGSLLTFSAKEPGNFFGAIYARYPDGHVKRILGLQDPFADSQVVTINADSDRTAVTLRVGTSGASMDDIALYRVTLLSPSAIEVPTLSSVGIAVLVLALTLGGLWFLRPGRRRPP